jgi:hypothetical protein
MASIRTDLDFGLRSRFLGPFLPETYKSTILLRRAEHLRKLTGNPNL